MDTSSRLGSFITKLSSWFNFTKQDFADDTDFIPQEVPKIPDSSTLEQTVYMLERVRTVFDYAPPIPLVSDMRIINKGLSCLYYTPKISYQLDDKNVIVDQVNHSVQKFSQILPEVDLLLNELENLPHSQAYKDRAEEIKQEIICSLEKVSYDANAMIAPSYGQDTKYAVTYNISYESDDKNNDE